MQLNQATDYAFRTVLYLAQLPPDSIVKAQVLADEELIPLRFLRKILRSLVREGLIRSIRGAEGGYQLAKPSDEINLLDVITAMEGPIALHHCLAEREFCNKHCSRECPVHERLRELQEQFVEGLQGATFSELLERKRLGKGEGCRRK